MLVVVAILKTGSVAVDRVGRVVGGSEAIVALLVTLFPVIVCARACVSVCVLGLTMKSRIQKCWD